MIGGSGPGEGGNIDRGPGKGSSGKRPDDAGNPGYGHGHGNGDGDRDHPDDSGNPGNGHGNGHGDVPGGGDGISDMSDDAPTPPDVLLQDPGTADWTATYVVKRADITRGYDGTTPGDDPTGMDMTTSMVTKDGIEMHPIGGEFGFYVTGFIGATDKVRDDDDGEGWAGVLPDGGIAVSDARTVTFSDPAQLGAWREGIGSNFVKASTEHCSVMQAILSDQEYPGDESGYYQPDDDLWVVDYLTGDNGMPVDELGVASSTLVEDAMHGFCVHGLVEALEEAEGYMVATALSKDFDHDGTLDTCAASGTVVERLDGTLLGYLNVDTAGDPIGTGLRDFSLIETVEGSTLAEIGALSGDLEEGDTEAWYTTMDREPFVAVLNDDGTCEIGPRWRLQPDKYGQDLPSVTIPLDPSDPLPISNGEEKCEVGVGTTTVLTRSIGTEPRRWRSAPAG